MGILLTLGAPRERIRAGAVKNKIIILSTIVFIALTSCKKDKLEGEKSILIGEWEWVYTEKLVDYCHPDYMYTQILTPQTENRTYQIIFVKKGKVTFYQNNEMIEQCRIVFNGFNAPACNNTSFEIHLNNDDSHILFGCVSQDTLTVMKDFPYPDKDVFEPGVDCYLTTNYFVRKSN